jgi:dTMP kinase
MILCTRRASREPERSMGSMQEDATLDRSRPMSEKAHHAAVPGMDRFLSGRFVVFDGPDGCGKSTQFRRFADWARAQGVVVSEVREPGGTGIGEQIRDILLDTGNAEMTVRCEMLLYMASRAQLLEERVRPALARGELVLADRFVSSTLAYQGTAGGMEREEILEVAKVAVGSMWPDDVVIFDVDIATAATRMNAARDRIEQKDASFHERVRQGYLQQCREDPARCVTVDARVDADGVFASLVGAFEARMKAGIAPRTRA